MKTITDEKILYLAALGRLRITPIDSLPKAAKKNMFRTLNLLGEDDFENLIVCLMLAEDYQRTILLSLKTPSFYEYYLPEVANLRTELLEKIQQDPTTLSHPAFQLNETVLPKEHSIHRLAQDYSERLKAHHPTYWS